jgi:HEAT repeats
MISDKNAMLLLGYLDDTLSAEERQTLENQLATDTELRTALSELQETLLHFEQMPEALPSSAVDDRFASFLAAEKTSEKAKTKFGYLVLNPKLGWSAAAAVALLLIGGGFAWLVRVNQQQQREILSLHEEIRSTQKMMVLGMLEKPSASDRIQAVNVLGREKADPDIIKALVYTLNFDDMVNVRMEAAQALSMFSYDATAKSALINSLKTEKSPEVQITIIEILTALGDQQAVPTLRIIMDNPNLMNVVRDKAAESIGELL